MKKGLSKNSILFSYSIIFYDRLFLYLICWTIFIVTVVITKMAINIKVIVAPGGVPHSYETVNPVNIPVIPTTIPTKITHLKLLLIRMAIAAGRIIIADTSKAPAIGMITAIVTPVITLKRIDINRAGKPAVKAVSSSKVNTYIGLRKTKNNTTTIINNAANK